MFADNCYPSASLVILLEIWTKVHDLYPLPNHVVVHRVDAENYRHGYGILVYCINKFANDVQVIVDFNNEKRSKSFNLVLLKICGIYVCAGYKPHSTPFSEIWQNLEICLKIVAENAFGHLVIVGDFNVDLLKSPPQIFLTLFSRHNLKNKILNKPSTDGMTQLDMCFSNISHLKSILL